MKGWSGCSETDIPHPAFRPTTPSSNGCDYGQRKARGKQQVPFQDPADSDGVCVRECVLWGGGGGSKTQSNAIQNTNFSFRSVPCATQTAPEQRVGHPNCANGHARGSPAATAPARGRGRTEGLKLRRPPSACTARHPRETPRVSGPEHGHCTPPARDPNAVPGRPLRPRRDLPVVPRPPVDHRQPSVPPSVIRQRPHRVPLPRAVLKAGKREGP